MKKTIINLLISLAAAIQIPIIGKLLKLSMFSPAIPTTLYLAGVVCVAVVLASLFVIAIQVNSHHDKS